MSAHKSPRLSMRLSFALHCLIALAVVILVNVLAGLNPEVKDLSANRDVTLSEQSVNILQHVDRDLRVVIAVRRDHPLYRRVYDLAAAADRVINDRINLDTIDPIRDPNKASELVDSINARIREHSDKGAEPPPYTLEGDKVIVISGDVIKQIEVTDMVLEESLPEGGTTSLFRGEQLFISAILSATQPEQDIVGLITGLGEPPGGPIGPERIANALPFQNAVLAPLNLENATEIPEQIKTLIFYGPQNDLSNHAAQLVHDYWNDRRGGLVYFLEPGTIANLPRLLALPRLHGVLPREDRVVRVISGLDAPQVGYSLSAPLSVVTPWNPEWERLQRNSANLNQNDLTSRVAALAETPNLQAISLPPQSLSLRLDEQMLRQRQGRGRITEILTSPDGYWSESDPIQNPPSFDSQQDESGPLSLAAVVDTDPGAADEGNRSARMVVIGNAGLISEKSLAQNNFDFVLNAINWSMAKENVIGIAPKRPELFAFELDAATNSRVQLVYAGLIPASLLAIALMVHQLRRK